MSDATTVDPVDSDTIIEPAEVDEPIEGEEALGDPGKKALNTMKEQRNAALKEAREAKAERDAVKAKLEGREAEYTAEVEKNKTRDEAILRAELKAAAKGKLADPADAALFLDTKQFEVDGNGDVDADALNTAIDDLIARKPHLAAAPQRRFDGDADAGPKRDNKASQITSREELSRMTPEQRVEAEAAGRLDTLLGRG
jgi:hypothetical protein